MSVNLNARGGIIKGDAKKGIAQSSTEGDLILMKVDEQKIQARGPFMEFVWRAPGFTDFIGYQATDVIESVYKNT